MTAPVVIDVSALPADVRKAGPDAQKLYSTALAFEKVLVEQLTKQLDPSSSEGMTSDDSDSEDSGSDGSTAMYSQMLPGAFAQGISDAGGVGLADQLYRSLAKASK
jgi:Rod binding domain-containing protein